MAKAFWKVAGDAVTLVVPESVERVQPLDDQEFLDVFGVSAVDGQRVTMTRVGLVNFVDSVMTLAADQIREDLSVGGALRWARRRADALVAAGWAKREWTGGIEAV